MQKLTWKRALGGTIAVLMALTVGLGVVATSTGAQDGPDRVLSVGDPTQSKDICPDGATIGIPVNASATAQIKSIEVVGTSDAFPYTVSQNIISGDTGPTTFDDTFDFAFPKNSERGDWAFNVTLTDFNDKSIPAKGTIEVVAVGDCAANSPRVSLRNPGLTGPQCPNNVTLSVEALFENATGTAVVNPVAKGPDGTEVKGEAVKLTLDGSAKTQTLSVVLPASAPAGAWDLQVEALVDGSNPFGWTPSAAFAVDALSCVPSVAIDDVTASGKLCPANDGPVSVTVDLSAKASQGLNDVTVRAEPAGVSIPVTITPVTVALSGDAAQTTATLSVPADAPSGPYRISATVTDDAGQEATAVEETNLEADPTCDEPDPIVIIESVAVCSQDFYVDVTASATASNDATITSFKYSTSADEDNVVEKQADGNTRQSLRLRLPTDTPLNADYQLYVSATDSNNRVSTAAETFRLGQLDDGNENNTCRGVDPTTPTPTATATPDPSATATATATPDPNATATATPDPNATATATPDPSATATPDPNATATPVPTADPGSGTPSPTTGPIPTLTPTPGNGGAGGGFGGGPDGGDGVAGGGGGGGLAMTGNNPNVAALTAGLLLAFGTSLLLGVTLRQRRR